MKTNRNTAIAALLLALAPLVAFAQTAAEDPAIQKAKDETAVVYDLGRVFGYLATMDKEAPKLVLSRDQLLKLMDVMTTIKATKRFVPKEAEKLLVKIEDTILTAAQLAYVDQLAIAKAATRGTGTGEGAGSGSGPLTTYIAGGDFNPMLDTSKTLGKDFAAFYDYAAKKVGK
jgi:hypothetical protein